MAKEIVLTRGKVATVDDADFEWLNQWRWLANGNYAMRFVGPRSRRRSIRMHRLIVNAPEGWDVDHIDGNPLNNTRANLRVCTRRENQQNKRAISGSSRYKGVSYHTSRGTWEAAIQVDGRPRFLGRWRTEREAAEAYNEAARKHFGAFARLNTIDEVAA